VPFSIWIQDRRKTLTKALANGGSEKTAIYQLSGYLRVAAQRALPRCGKKTDDRVVFCSTENMSTVSVHQMRSSYRRIFWLSLVRTSTSQFLSMANFIPAVLPTPSHEVIKDWCCTAPGTGSTPMRGLPLHAPDNETTGGYCMEYGVAHWVCELYGLGRTWWIS